jgi:hypothetical protein
MNTSPGDYPVLQHVMRLLDAPGGALEDEPLLPDGRYQTRTVTLRQLSDEVTARLSDSLRGLSAAEFPRLFCSWGKCRVGSTALTNLFGIAGIPAFYQPVKTMMRHRLLGSEPQPWVPPQASTHPQIFSKEMAGPYLVAETIFNPVDLLIASGYPAAKLHLVVMDRDPYSSLASWVARWSDRVPRARLVEHFVLSSLQIHRMRTCARANGVPLTHFAYEASRRPLEAIAALFERLDISRHFHPGVVNDWNERGALESSQSGISFPEEPPVYVVPGLHSSERQYAYKGRDASNLTAAERDLVAALGLPELYRDVAGACVQDLGLDASVAAEMFGPELAASAHP